MPWAFLFPNMPLKIFPEVFYRALERLNGTGCKGAEGMARPEQFTVLFENFDVSGLAGPFFDRTKDFFKPGQPVATGSAPTAGLTREKHEEVPDEPDRAGLVVEHDHGAGAEPGTRFHHRVEIHFDVEMIMHEKIGGRAARDQAAESMAVLHTACMDVQQFPHGYAHGKLPDGGFFYAAAHAE